MASATSRARTRRGSSNMADPRKLAEPLAFSASAIAWLALIGHAQLGLRHPEVGNDSATMADELIGQILLEIRQAGAITQEEFLQMSSDAVGGTAP